MNILQMEKQDDPHLMNSLLQINYPPLKKYFKISAVDTQDVSIFNGLIMLY